MSVWSSSVVGCITLLLWWDANLVQSLQRAVRRMKRRRRVRRPMMPPDDSSQDDPMTSAAVAAMFTEAQTGSEFCIIRRDYYTKLTHLKT